MELFSAASNDRHPQHSSAVYARQSPFGHSGRENDVLPSDAWQPAEVDLDG